MRRLLSSVSAIILLSAIVPSGAYAGWDQKALEAQTQGAVYMRAKIEKLEKENEILRNSINKMRAETQTCPTPQDSYSYDARIQALIEENKRLAGILEERNVSGGGVTDMYSLKIDELKKENETLRNSIAMLSAQNAANKQAKSEDNSALLEENLRLKAALSQKNAKNETLENLQREIYALKQKNEALESEKVSALSLSSKVSEADLQAKDQKIADMQNKIMEMQTENRGLAKALAESSAKAMSFQEKALGATESETDNLREIASLRGQLVDLKQKNASLEQDIVKSKVTKQENRSSAEVEALKKQNESLRETIRAQNEVLVSSDNAGHTADRLISENEALKRQLVESEKAVKANAESARQVLAQYQSVQVELVNKTKYIQKLEGFKKAAEEKVMQIQSEDRLNVEVSNENPEKIDELKDTVQSLQAALDKERESIIAYRSKIKEYQEELQDLKNALASGVEVKAIPETEEKHAANFEDVRYVETSYPPVEKVLPLLDKDGSKIDYGSDADDELKAEDLLSKELTPLNKN